MSAPSLTSLLFSHWKPDRSLSLEAAATVGFYLWGTRRVRGRWPVPRTVSFLGGITCVLIALESGIEAYDDELLSVHMVQHLILLLLAPLLLLGGRPMILALRTLPSGGRRRLVRILARVRLIAGPWQGLALYFAVAGITHLAWFYDATLTHPLLHDAEHGLYLISGALLLWPILDGDPLPSQRLGGLGKLIYVLASMVPMAVIGAYLNRHTTVVYAPYSSATRALGVLAVRDQADAGAIMWVVGNTTMVAIGLWATMATLLGEERRLRAREPRGADPALGPAARERQ
jgi:putative copper resistance protein D